MENVSLYFLQYHGVTDRLIARTWCGLCFVSLLLLSQKYEGLFSNVVLVGLATSGVLGFMMGIVSVMQASDLRCLYL